MRVGTLHTAAVLLLPLLACRDAGPTELPLPIPIETSPSTDREILALLYETTNGPGWKNSWHWLSHEPLHTWYGVDVGANGRVSRLWLYNNGLTGRIPAEIGGLSELRSLSLGWNELAGSIPTELGDLAALEQLWLQGNDLTGRIPAEVGGLSELRSLNLKWNELAGSIPTELGDLAALEQLWLEGNDLTGWIPAEIGGLSELQTLELEDNDLTGPIPPEIGRLAGLRVLRFGGNDLTGPIPPEIASLAGLRRLELWSNDLTGPIPPSLGNLTSLQSLSLAQNDLSGPVPAELARLILLRELAVNGNPQLSGLLPAGFKDLWGLTTLNAGGTALCAPADPDFLAWLGRLQNPRVRRCGNDTLSVYLTQAVQSFEFPVPLVANVPALLRVFLTAPDGEAIGFPPVRARFYLEGAEVHTVDIPRSPGTIPSRLDEGRLEASANVAIPAEVVQPGLELVVEIDPEDTLGPEPGITKRIPAAGRHAIDVRAVPALHLTYLPVVRSRRRSAEFLNRVRDLTEADTLFRRVRQWLPVAGFDVALHDIVYTSARTGGELISEIEAIRVLEGGTGYYMGGLPQYLVEDLGLAGSARLAGWASVSRVRSITIAHELGHNMSLEHAPCGSASRPDPGFPTRDGTIGAWGYNPTDNSLVSPEMSDLMSYCGPKWISEYSFTKAFDHRLRGEGLGSATATTAGNALSILLWGGIDGEGVPFLEPAFVVDAPPTHLGPAGPYTLMGRTAEGEELFLFRFDMQEMADGDGESGFAFALPASPTWADRLATVVLVGPGGTATLRDASGPPAALLRDPQTGRIRGILRDLTSPGSGLATLAGAAADPVSIASFFPDVANIEVLISRGLPAAEQWRR